MIAIAWYVLKVTICSGILCGYYFLALRNNIFHRWNRFYLLSAMVISLAAPLIKINISQNTEAKGSVIHILQSISYGDEAVVEYSRNNTFQFSAYELAQSIYLLVSISLLMIFLISLLHIRRLKKRFSQTRIGDISFINTNAKGTPFSFFKSIFWNDAIDLHSKSGQQIFNHEIVHVKQQHSVDKIFLSLVLIFFWINPFFWIMKRELYMIHEFIADKEALEDSDVSAFAAMILQSVYPGQDFSLSNAFFYSPIKRRIMMLTKNKNPKVSYLGRLLVLPLAAIVFFAFTVKVKTHHANTYSGKPLTVIIDAGHGGDDNGAVYSGVKEKDLTIAVAKKIVELNSNSRLRIILSRRDDQSISVRDRVTFSKEKNADIFVSLHVNATVNGQGTGFSVVTPGKNNEQDQMLASALVENLSPVFPSADTQIWRSHKIMVLDDSQCPAALVEMGYMNNPQELAFLENKNNQEKIALAILNAIDAYAAAKNENVSQVSLNDTIPDGNYSIKEIKGRDGVFVDTRREVIIHANKFIYPSTPAKTNIDVMKAVLVINGKIEPNRILKEKTISAETVIMHSGDEKDMIAKYGDRAKNGVVVFEDAVISNEKPAYPQPSGKASSEDKIFTATEISSQFPGGSSAWVTYISQKIRDSINSFTKADYGTCILRFIVDKDGSVRDVTATTMKGTRLAEVAINAIQNGPKWAPALQNGRKVASYRLQPVTLTEPKDNTSSPVKPNSSSYDKKIFIKVEKDAQFPGGPAAWAQYIAKHIQASIDSFSNKDYGTCVVRFIVDRNGTVSDVTATTMKGTQLAKISVNAIRNGPAWIPGSQNGINVASYRLQPVTLTNPADKEEK